MIFLRTEDAIAIHSELIDRFGGAHGLRDQGLLESALAAAENRFHYENADVPAIAAMYAFHLTKAHPFIDGNKRIAAAASEVFVLLNGHRLSASNEQIVETFLGMAAGLVSRRSRSLLSCEHRVS